MLPFDEQLAFSYRNLNLLLDYRTHECLDLVQAYEVYMHSVNHIPMLNHRLLLESKLLTNNYTKKKKNTVNRLMTAKKKVSY